MALIQNILFGPHQLSLLDASFMKKEEVQDEILESTNENTRQPQGSDVTWLTGRLH